MKYLVRGILLLILIGTGGLFFLGQQSQSGAPAGLASGLLTPCPSSPNCISSESNTAAEQRVDPLPVAAWSQLPAIIESMGGTVTKQDGDYLAAEFTSSLFRFVDDVEFRLDADAVQVRSASRAGYSDAGVNAERVTALRALLAQ